MDWFTLLSAMPLSLLGIYTADEWKSTLAADSIPDGQYVVYPTAGSQIEVRLMADSTLAVISTVDVLGTHDSELRLYDARWNRLKSPVRPTAASFYVANDSVDAETFVNLLQPELITLRFGEEGRVEASIDPKKFLPKESYEKVRPGLRPTVTYTLDVKSAALLPNIEQ